MNYNLLFSLILMLLHVVVLALLFLAEMLTGLLLRVRRKEIKSLRFRLNLLTVPAALWLYLFLDVPSLPLHCAVAGVKYYVYRSFGTARPLSCALSLLIPGLLLDLLIRIF